MKMMVLFISFFLGLSANASFWIPDGSVTTKKIAPLNVTYGPPVVYDTTSPSPIPNVSFTASGNRPIMVSLESAVSGIGAGNGAVWMSNTATTNLISGDLSFIKNGSSVRLYNLIMSIQGTSTAGLMQQIYPCSSFSFIDASPTAGAVTYNFSPVALSNTKIYIGNCRLVVREL